MVASGALFFLFSLVFGYGMKKMLLELLFFFGSVLIGTFRWDGRSAGHGTGTRQRRPGRGNAARGVERRRNEGAAGRRRRTGRRPALRRLRRRRRRQQRQRQRLQGLSHSIRFDSIRFNSIRFDSIQFDSIQFDSVQFG